VTNKFSVVIISAIRIRSIYLFGISGDPTWDNVDLTIWTAFEVAVAVICCNLPSIAGLVTHYRRIYFPAHDIHINDSARPLKWTGTSDNSGLASPRYPLSPRFPPEKGDINRGLKSIDEDTFTTSDENWMGTGTMSQTSQPSSIRNSNLELGKANESRDLSWNVGRDSLTPQDQSMSPIQRIRASLRVGRRSAGWPIQDCTDQHSIVSTNSLTSAPNHYRSSHLNTSLPTTITIHPATQTPTILPSPLQPIQISPHGSPYPSPPSPNSIEEGQPWPLPLRPPPFHVRRQNWDINGTSPNSKRVFSPPSPIVISPRLQLWTTDMELASIRTNEDSRAGMI
jgi:hypothetical protein